MRGLPTELCVRCRNVLAKCAEFESNALLRAVFVTEELTPFKGGVQEAGSKSDRIDICLEFLLSKQFSDGRHAFQIFLETLRDRYRDGDLLRDELDGLAHDVSSTLSPSPRVSRAVSHVLPARGGGETADNQIIIRISNDNGQYFGNITYRGRTTGLGRVKIGPNDWVKIKGEKRRLDELTTVANIPFGESGRLATGQYLYGQVCANLPRFGRIENLDIRILTADEHAGKVPWELLAEDTGMFLAIAGCAISRSIYEEWPACEMPEHPKILVAAPKPDGFPDTGAVRHVEEHLMGMLTETAGHRYYPGNRLRIATTWDEFQTLTKDFRPDAVYFYGHVKHDGDQISLVFSNDKSRQGNAVSASDFAHFFRRLPEKVPPVVYVNCLQGDAGGMFGVGRQLAGAGIPAVLVNHGPLPAETAQELGLAFWRRILLDGQPPHEAARNLRNDIGNPGPSNESRWTVPIPYCHYGRWHSHPPKKLTLIHDPHWSLKLDRVNQISKVSYLTRLMLKEQKPKIIAYLWCGDEGQGVDLFHHRLKVELRDELATACLMEIKPVWPVTMIDPNQPYEDMMLEAFNAETMTHIPARIRAHSHGRTNRQTLVYVRHTPLRSVKLMTLERLKQYMEWLNTYFAPLLEKDCHAMFGISYVVKSPEKFHQTAEKKVVGQLALPKTTVHLLDEMGAVVKRDLLEFIKTHNIVLPQGRIGDILDKIVAKTGGNYEITLDELRQVIDRPHDFSPDETDGEEEEGGFGVDD